jgi:16S rRNA (cytosine1402-N4)-methyltransferase
MTGGGGQDPSDHGAAGGPARHVPVLREEVMVALDLRAGLYVDGTFGAGGYTRAILETPGTRVIALDRDPTAIRGGQTLVEASDGRLTLVEDRFANLAAALIRLDIAGVEGVALDIGVSSMQIDQAERGFSFRNDGPLDMRMSASGRTAADIVNEASEEAIADILYYFGEERLSRRIAKAIVMDRQAKPFLTTRPLAEMIARVAPGKPNEIHPATRTFQALRIAVNDELGELVAGLAAAERMLAPGGRLAVVTFHSLEDRIVKQFLAKRSGKGEAPGRRLPGEPAPIPPSFTLPRGQPIAPSDAECRENPRARSAKLRIGIRTDHPALAIEPDLMKHATLPSTAPKTGKSR